MLCRTPFTATMIPDPLRRDRLAKPECDPETSTGPGRSSFRGHAVTR